MHYTTNKNKWYIVNYTKKEIDTDSYINSFQNDITR